MRLSKATLPVERLLPNEGQLPGVPRNPRKIRKEDFERLVDSIRDNPEMLDLRELVVAPYEGDTFVTLCGNMRLEALRSIGVDAAPCKIVDNAPAGKLRRIALKDNEEAGEWDIDALLKEWSVDELTRFGLKDIERRAAALDPDKLGDDFSLPDGGKRDERVVSVAFSEEQAAAVRLALKRREEEAREESASSGNMDTNACAFYLIMRQWAEREKSR